MRVLLHAALKTSNVLVPRNGAQVVLVFVTVVDGSKGAASRARTDVGAVDERGEAVEIFTIEGKGIGVLVKWLRELMALVELVHRILASAGGVGAGAKQDLKGVSI